MEWGMMITAFYLVGALVLVVASVSSSEPRGAQDFGRKKRRARPKKHRDEAVKKAA